VYDVAANAGFVSVGITSDTAEFAVQSIRRWRERMGRQRYPKARELTITADCGGRSRDPRPSLSTGHIQVEQRSSTGCSVTSPRTGAAGRSPIGLPWLS
jgi:hypothetical protein